MAKKVLLKVISLIILVFACMALHAQPMPDGSDQAMATVADTSWKKDRGFKYMQNIDSLLRMYNKLADSMRRHETHRVSITEREPFFTGFLNLPVIKFLFWLMIAIFILFVIFRLFRFNVFKRSEEDNAPSEIMNTGILNMPEFYTDQIMEAERTQNFPLAVRFQFVRSLAFLSENDRIHFQPEKTNAEYASELSDGTLQSAFRSLSRLYEYTWYGKNAVSADRYERIKSAFSSFNKMI